MKTPYLLVLLSLISINVFGRKPKKVEPEKPKFTFTTIKEVPYTSIKNQFSSGTCWSFSGLAMLESEVLRLKKDTVDLSEMWVVRNSYFDKVEKYIRMHGNINLAAGGSFADVLQACKQSGMLPEEVYPGLAYGSKTHHHAELDRVIEQFGQSVVSSNKPSTAWRAALNGILDAYFGAVPNTFTYKGVQYTPQTFTQSLGLHLDDYISLTSFSHHPFYQAFVLEIPDNWSYSTSWNVPIQQLEAIIDSAIFSGYSVAWATDVSEKSFTRDMASVPEEKETEIVGSDQAKWTGKKETVVSDTSEVEKTITQEMRQEAFDNYTTTDDHGMQIVGLVKDQNGRVYYKVKNSWGNKGEYKGILYATKAFMLYKTTNIVVHKDALKKAGIILNNKL